MGLLTLSWSVRARTIMLGWIGAAMVLLSSAPLVAQQSVTIDPTILRGKLIASDGLPGFNFGRGVSVDGDTAVVGAPQFGIADGGAAYVFSRRQDGSNAWHEVAKLTPSDAAEPGGPGFFGELGSVAISGDTVVVGAPGNRGAAYVFSRNQGGLDAWGQVKKLFHPGGPDFRGLGVGVAIDGDVAVVGSFSGAAYVYSRDSGGPNEWGLVGVLSSRDRPGAFIGFGFAVAISGGTIVVGAPDDDDGGTNAGAAYVFAPGLGCCPPGSTWGEVKKLTADDADADAAFGLSVSISGTTILVGAPAAGRPGANLGAAYVFERDQNGPDMWGQVARLQPADGEGLLRSRSVVGFGHGLSINADLAAVGAYQSDGFGSFTGAGYVFSRHHGGPHAWGEVVKLAAADVVGPGGGLFALAVSLSGNTLLAGNSVGEAAYACQLDDLDGPDGACRRAPLVFDNLVTVSNVQQSCCADSELVLTATFMNTSATAIYMPGILVTELTGGNVLKNADGGPAAAGATMTLDVGDDFLSPGESTTVRFVIGLATTQPFQFFVHVTGEHEP